MAYIIWDVGREIVEGGPLRWYSVCWMLGIVAGYMVMRSIFRVERVHINELDLLALYTLLGGIIGARLGHVLFYDPGYYLSNPIEILPFKINPRFEFTGFAGLASHGGTLGALLALYLYKRKYGRSYRWALDRLIIGAAVLGGFIRLGNLMNSEIIGTPTGLPWAFVFTGVDDIPRHPAQLYEAIAYFVTGIALYLVWRSRKYETAQGFIFGLGLTMIFAMRFLIEFIKENQVSFEDELTLNMGQLLSIPLVMVGVILMMSSRNYTAKEHLDS